MPRPEEAYEESQSRSERCTVCENYYTRGDIASSEPVICFYCYEESHDGMESNMDIETRKKLKSIVSTMYVKMVGKNIPKAIIKDLDKIHGILWDDKLN